MTNVRITIDGPSIFEQGVFALGRVYNHPQTNKHTKQFIRFELQRILGNDKDIVGFLKEPQCQIEKPSK